MDNARPVSSPNSNSSPSENLANRDERRRLANFTIEQTEDPRFWIRRDGEIFHANATAHQFLAWDAGELSHRTIADLNPDLTKQAWSRLWDDVQQNHGQTFESTLLTRLGETRSVEISVRCLEFEGQEFAFLVARDSRIQHETEASWQRSQQQLKETEAIGHLGSFEWTIATNHLEWSEELFRIYGRSPREFTPTLESFLECIVPEDRSRVLANLQQALVDQDTFQAQERICRPDGEVRTLDSRGKIDRDERGNPIRVVGICKDISERLRVKESLEKTSDLLRAVANETTDAIFVKDLQGRYLFFNEAASQFVGVPVDEVLGKDDTALFVNDERLEKMMRNDRAIMLTGQVRTQEENLTANGVTRTYLSTKGPYKDRSGNVLGLVGISRDITDRLLAEQALRHTESQLRQLIENVFAPVAMLDRELRYLHVSRRWITDFHLTDHDLRGKSHYEIFPEVPSHWKEVLQRCLRGAVERCDEESFPRADGSLQWLRWEVSPWWHPSGEIGGIVIYCEDITERKLTSERIAQSEKRFTQLFYSSPFSILVATYPEGVILDANNAYLNIFQTTREEIIGKTTRELDIWVNPDDRRVMIESVREHQRFSNGEFWFRTAKGEKRLLLLSVELIEIQGQPIAMAMSIDITERRAAELALNTSEERYRLAIRAMNDAIWDLDLITGIVSWNDRYDQEYGRPADTNQSWDWWVERIHEEDRTRTVDSLCQTLSTNQQNWVGEYRFQKKDGTWAEIHDRAFISRDADGTPTRVVGAMQDLTERNRAANELQASQRMIQAVAEASPLTIYVFDLERQGMLYSNYHVMKDLGYSSEQVAKFGPEEFQQLVHPEDWNNFPRLFERWNTVRDGEILETEYRVRHADGSWHSMVSRDTVFSRNEQGRVTQVVGTAQDVTERKRIARQLQESQKMEAIGRLAGGVAHDFNNLLTIINGYADLLLAKQSPDDPCRKSVSEIREAGQRAAELTRQLLSFSRKALISPQALNLNVKIRASESLLQHFIGERNQLVLHLAPQLGSIRVDSGQIDQLLMNLCTNARDAFTGEGSVTIQTRQVTEREIHAISNQICRPGNYVELGVTDTGSGMPSEVVAHLFEPFFTTKDIGKGTGLGLAVVHGIVQQNGGEIHVISELGHGSQFTIWFPRTDDLPANDAVVTSPPPDSHSRTILLVEDDPAVRKLIRLMLESFDFGVVEVGHANDALRYFRKHASAIDLLMTDLAMPEIDGTQLARQIWTIRPGFPVLFTSGNPDVLQIVNFGGEDELEILQKPLNPQQLLIAIQKRLSPKKNEA